MGLVAFRLYSMKLPLAAIAAIIAMPSAYSQYLRGVNLSGAEFGAAHLPGTYNTDYTFQSEMSFRYFGGRNLDLIRFPLQWERLQRQLRGPLDPDYLALLKQAIGWSKAHGGKFIMEVHNFARYNGVVVSGPDLADLWLRLSGEFKNDDGVFAYDIMNEPHDLGSVNWKTISQMTLDAIRSNGDGKLVMIPGDSWSSANRWVTTHGARAWITDSANNFLYEAHQYFDSDESGTYTMSYDTELRRNPALANIGTTRVAPFVAWCRSNNVSGYLGEYGVPNNDPRWLAVLDSFLSAIDDAGMPGTYWAAGEWWNDYALSVQPQGNFTIDRVQMPVLSAHLTPGTFTTVPSASFSGAILASDSLASGFGANLGTVNEIDVVDAQGVTTVVLPLFVSATQVNYVVPAGLAQGHYRAMAKSAGSVGAQGNLEIDSVAPSLFGGAGQIVRVHPDATQSIEDIAGPVDLGDALDRVFLVLYGTGFRNSTRRTLQVGGKGLAVAYAGAQGGFPGLDQLNAELPRSLVGAGAVNVVLVADGRPANVVALVFR